MPSEPTVLQQLALRFGRRGLKLITLGLGFAAFGAQVIAERRDRFSAPGPGPLDWADSRAWGTLFVVGGIVAFVVGCRRRNAPDWIGFAGLVAPALTWTLLYAISAIVHVGSGHVYGQDGGAVYFLIWLAIATSIRVDAGWDDPADPVGHP